MCRPRGLSSLGLGQCPAVMTGTRLFISVSPRTGIGHPAGSQCIDMALRAPMSPSWPLESAFMARVTSSTQIQWGPSVCNGQFVRLCDLPPSGVKCFGEQRRRRETGNTRTYLGWFLGSQKSPALTGLHLFRMFPAVSACLSAWQAQTQIACREGSVVSLGLNSLNCVGFQ